MKNDEYRRKIESVMLERDLQNQILEIARDLGWLAYHTYDSRRSVAGFPDLVLVRDRRIIFAELKSRDGKPSADQAKWLQALKLAGKVEVYLWRPADLLDGSIQQHLAWRGA